MHLKPDSRETELFASGKFEAQIGTILIPISYLGDIASLPYHPFSPHPTPHHTHTQIKIYRSVSHFCFMPQDETRERLVTSDNKVRLLETQVCKEKNVSASWKKVIMSLTANLDIFKYVFLYLFWQYDLTIMPEDYFPTLILHCLLEQRVEELENEIKKLREELESEKV